MSTKGGRNASRTPEIQRIHLMEASMQFDDSIGQMEHDLRYALAQAPDVIGFTEITSSAWKNRLRNVCRELGYQPIILTKNIQLAVKTGGPGKVKVKDKGQLKAGEGSGGSIKARFIGWVRISWYEMDIFVHCCHWSRMRLGAERHTDITNTFAALVKKHGQNGRLSFFMGDLNINEGTDNRTDAPNMPNHIFRENGLLTIWDEFREIPPPTLGNVVFDVIGSYRPDAGVTAGRYLIHPKQNSDHSFVSGWYDIDVSKKTSTGLPTAIGTTGDPIDIIGRELPDGQGGDPYPYDYVSGNISWADYLDDDVYALPYAYGDSDSHRHG